MDKTTAKQVLDVNLILGKEFDYAAQTAFQAHEDRSKIFNYYLATIATIVASAAFAATSGTRYFLLLSFVFFALTVLGLISFLQLIKLRISWAESVRAMCRIKDYYLSHSGDAELETAFYWTTESIPPVGKTWSIAFLMAFSVILLSSVAFGAAFFLLAAARGVETGLTLGAIAGFILLSFQLALWFWLT